MSSKLWRWPGGTMWIWPFGRYSAGGEALPAVDFAQQFQVDFAPATLGVVDFAQGITVTGDPAPASGTPLTRYGADLHQWLRGDIITLNGGNVSSWTDQSGKGNHAAQGTPAAQPAYVAVDATCDNRAAVYSDGIDDFLLSNALTCNLASEDFYIAFIFKQLSWTGASRCFSGGSGSFVPRVLSHTSGSPNMRMAATSAVNINSGAPVGTWVRGEALWTTTAGASYLKLGSTTVQTGNPGTGTRTISSIFATAAGGVGSAFIDAAVAEYIVVKRAAGSGGPTGPERVAQDAAWLARYPSAVF